MLVNTRAHVSNTRGYRLALAHQVCLTLSAATMSCLLEKRRVELDNERVDLEYSSSVSTVEPDEKEKEEVESSRESCTLCNTVEEQSKISILAAT